MWAKLAQLGMFFHTTSVSNVGSILKNNTLLGKDFVSFALKSIVTGDIEAKPPFAVLVFNTGIVRQLNEVEYTEEWFNANPEEASYIAGKGWSEQYVSPVEPDEDDWVDDDEEAQSYSEAELDAFLQKSNEKEWISRDSEVTFNDEDLVKIIVFSEDDKNLLEKYVPRNVNVEIKLS